MTGSDAPHSDLVSPQMLDQYRAEGYFVLESVLSADELELLRSGAQYSMDRLDAQMDAEGVDRLGINARGKRYFSAMVYQERPELRSFVLGPTMAAICRRVLGPEAYLFWEQYVIKAADPDTAFAWHQDSGYVHEDHEPYLTCWIALDDVTEENGSVYLLPVQPVGDQVLRQAHSCRDRRRGVLLRQRPGDAGDRPGRVDRLLLQHRHPPQRPEPHRPAPPGLPAAVLPGGDHGQGRPAAVGILRAVPGRRKGGRRGRSHRMGHPASREPYPASTISDSAGSQTPPPGRRKVMGRPTALDQDTESVACT